MLHLYEFAFVRHRPSPEFDHDLIVGFLTIVVAQGMKCQLARGMRTRLKATHADLAAQCQRFLQARIEIATDRLRLSSDALFSLPGGGGQQLSL